MSSRFVLRKTLFFLLLPFLYVFISSPAIAQVYVKNEKDTTGDRSLIVSIQYNSDRVVYGRKLSTKLTNMAPSLSYASSSGFFTDLTLYRLLQPVKKIYEIDWSAGWDFNLSKKLKAGASYSHFFYSKDSLLQQYQLRSSLLNQFEANISADLKIVTPKLYFDYLFGSSSHDFIMTLDLTHRFTIIDPFTEDNDELLIEPTASLFLGTNNYVSLYKKGVVSGISAVNKTKFGYSGVEFFLPVEYDIGKFIFTVAGHYNIPQPQSISIPSNINLSKKALEQINGLTNSSPVFYFTVSVGFVII